MTLRFVRGTALVVTLAACAPTTTAPDLHAPLAFAETAFLDARDARDRIDVARELGDARVPEPTTAELEQHARDALATVSGRLRSLTEVDSSRLGADDARALATMRRVIGQELVNAHPMAADAAPACDYEPRGLIAGDSAYESLSRRIYACYTRVVQQVRVGDSTTDRLSVLSMLGREGDAAARKHLFLALDTIWRTVNRDDGPTTSPYRLLAPLSALRWRQRGSPVATSATALGVRADDVERWLVHALERWRDASGGATARSIEPWDWWYEAGAASRRLSARIPLERLATLNEEVYASLGASPAALNVQYDLAPRAGKTAVAYTTFGARPRPGTADSTGQPWVFATYRVGGLDNLNELLHESGHAIHIAAIRTRPAFDDWPDSDTFTEALAELVAADVYEPAWQARWLGDSATTAENVRAKLAPVMLDIAWALFEVRMHREPTQDPNAVWTKLTHDYLHIAPHPELSWWAMRGQLVDLPGYMMNYALGAMITSELRAASRTVGGPYYGAWGTRWYPWLSKNLYAFGLSKSSGDVLRAALGHPLSPDALLREIDRLK